MTYDMDGGHLVHGNVMVVIQKYCLRKPATFSTEKEQNIRRIEMSNNNYKYILKNYIEHKNLYADHLYT